MTDYITIQGVQKRDFTIQAKMPELSDTEVTKVNADDTRIARNGDIRIARNGDTRIAHNTNLTHPRIVGGVQKRSFRINAKVKHG